MIYTILSLSYFLFFTFSCKKESDSLNLDFPVKYEFSDLAYPTGKVFIKTSTGFNEIIPAGSFTNFQTALMEEYSTFSVDLLDISTIELVTNNSAIISNDIVGNANQGLSFNAMYTTSADVLAITISDGIESYTLSATLDIANEKLFIYRKAIAYSHHLPDNSIHYSPIKTDYCNGPDYSLVTEDINLLQNMEVGDTLAVQFIQMIYH